MKAKLAGLALTLIGGIALRHAMVTAGKTSASDPAAAREATSAKRND